MAKLKKGDMRKFQEISGEGVKNARVCVLWGSLDGVSNYAMRHFVLYQEGHTPFHAHPWEHEVYVLKGEGKLVLSDRELLLKTGDSAYVKGNEPHQFVGSPYMEFLCVVPKGVDGFS